MGALPPPSWNLGPAQRHTHAWRQSCASTTATCVSPSVHASPAQRACRSTHFTHDRRPGLGSGGCREKGRARVPQVSPQAAQETARHLAPGGRDTGPTSSHSRLHFQGPTDPDFFPGLERFHTRFSATFQQITAHCKCPEASAPQPAPSRPHHPEASHGGRARAMLSSTVRPLSTELGLCPSWTTSEMGR